MIFDNNIFAPGTEPSPVDHESKALPLRQTTFGVSDPPDFHLFKKAKLHSIDLIVKEKRRLIEE